MFICLEPAQKKVKKGNTNNVTLNGKVKRANQKEIKLTTVYSFISTKL